MGQAWDITQVIVLLGLGLIWYNCRLFFKKYFEELGRQNAKLTVISEKTERIEEAKYPFDQALEELKALHNRELEELKASLNKENIAYRIYNARYIKLRFQRLDELYGKIYELKKYCEENLTPPVNYEDKQGLKNKIEKLQGHYKIAENALRRAHLYITDDKVADSAVNFLNKTSKALQALTVLYNIESRRNRTAEDAQPSELIEAGSEVSNQLMSSVAELPYLLINIEREFR